MTVTCDSKARASAYFTPGNRRTESGAGWGKYLDPEIQRQKMRALPEGEGLGSVYMQFKDDYRAWKAQQPEPVLPESQGWTEENLAFLKERYSGDLSAWEAYDALETMERMGAISRKEKNAAEGSTMIVFSMEDMGICERSIGPDSREVWLGGLDRAPMVGFRSLEDILSWVEAFRTEDHPDVITHAEAMARGWS